jgi:hypothetical protein
MVLLQKPPQEGDNVAQIMGLGDQRTDLHFFSPADKGGEDLRFQGRAANKAEILELRSAQVRCQHGILRAAMAGQDRAMHLFGQRGLFFPLPSWGGRGAVGGKAFPAQHDQHQQQRQQA